MRYSTPKLWPALCLALALSPLTLSACLSDAECQFDRDCPPNLVCHAKDGCIAPLQDGEECEKNGNCASGRCVKQVKDGICSRPCYSQEICPEGQSCQLFLENAKSGDRVVQGCLPHVGSGVRGQLCLEDRKCQSNICHDFLCTELCSSCGPLERCTLSTVKHQNYRSQVPICLPAANPRQQLLPGFVTAEAGSAEQSFTLPESVASFTVHALDDDGLQVAISSLVAPDSTELVDLTSSSPQLNPASSAPGVASVLVPVTDTPAAAPQAGKYTYRVSTLDPQSQAAVPGSIERVLVTYELLAERGGLLNLNLHFAAVTGIAAADAATSPYVAALRQYLRDYLGDFLGEMQFFDLPQPTSATLSHWRNLAISSVQTGQFGSAVNVFFVDGLGISGCVAGAMPGNARTDVHVSSTLLCSFSQTSSQMAAYLAHELGHFAGLQHTTDLQPNVWDALSDTPECTDINLGSDCPDYNNLMFPIAIDQGVKSWSQQQTQILQNSALLSEVVVPHACTANPDVIDLTEVGRGNAVVAGASRAQGSCGGASMGEKTLLYRLSSNQLAALKVTVAALDFDPLVYVRYAGCGEDATEVLCLQGTAGEPLEALIPTPFSGPYFIYVEGYVRVGDAGRFSVQVTEVPRE